MEQGSLKIYDAHIHFPLKNNNPFEVLKKEVKQSNLAGGLLIINSFSEAEVFWNNFEEIYDGDFGFIPEVAFYLDINESEWKRNFSELKKRGLSFAVKIHPRLSNLTISDKDKLIDKIYQIDTDKIIIDNWIYGPRIENHIGTELTIGIAEEFRNKRIIMAHAGGVRLLETMLLTRPLKNVFYDLSETCSYFKNTSIYKDIIHFIRYTKTRIMFGSDYPDFSIEFAKNMMREEMEAADLENDEINDIMYNTAMKIYSEN